MPEPFRITAPIKNDALLAYLPNFIPHQNQISPLAKQGSQLAEKLSKNLTYLNLAELDMLMDKIIKHEALIGSNPEFSNLRLRLREILHTKIRNMPETGRLHYPLPSGEFQSFDNFHDFSTTMLKHYRTDIQQLRQYYQAMQLIKMLPGNSMEKLKMNHALLKVLVDNLDSGTWDYPMSILSSQKADCNPIALWNYVLAKNLDLNPLGILKLKYTLSNGDSYSHVGLLFEKSANSKQIWFIDQFGIIELDRESSDLQNINKIHRMMMTLNPNPNSLQIPDYQYVDTPKIFDGRLVLSQLQKPQKDSFNLFKIKQAQAVPTK